MMMKTIKNKYIVTPTGKVWSIKSKQYLKPRLLRDGYYEIMLGDRSRHKVHRLVLQQYCPIKEPHKYTVNHRDFNRVNNRIDNLEWCTMNTNKFYNVVRGEYSELFREEMGKIDPQFADKLLRIHLNSTLSVHNRQEMSLYFD